MKPLFLISSAIHVKHGVFTAEQRLDQTILTLQSIRDKMPDADILVVESSGKQSITDEETEKLKPYIAGLLNFNPDQQVQEIYNMPKDNRDVLKNMTELIVFGKALNFILREQPELLNDVSRVFKMSGRYLLSESFDLKPFEDEKYKDNYIFSQRRKTQFPSIVTNGLTHQFMSRLWSWPTHKTALTFFRYNLMIEDFVGTNAQGKYRDIEHLLFRYFEGPYTTEFPIIGVEGQLGPNGATVKD